MHAEAAGNGRATNPLGATVPIHGAAPASNFGLAVNEGSPLLRYQGELEEARHWRSLRRTE
jgi:hypothetical protein